MITIESPTPALAKGEAAVVKLVYIDDVDLQHCHVAISDVETGVVTVVDVHELVFPANNGANAQVLRSRYSETYEQQREWCELFIRGGLEQRGVKTTPQRIGQIYDVWISSAVQVAKKIKAHLAAKGVV